MRTARARVSSSNFPSAPMAPVSLLDRSLSHTQGDSGSGLVIVAGQAKKLVGVTVESQAAFVQVWQVITRLNQAHALTAALGAASLATLVLLRHYAPRVPASLVVLLGAVAISAAGRLSEHGVAVV